MADTLRRRGYPVPRLVASGYVAGIGTWWLQEQLTGEPAQKVDEALLDQILMLNHLQADAGLPGTRNWSESARRLVSDDRERWRNVVREHPATEPVLQALLRLADHHVDAQFRGNDCVHADFKPEHVLVAEGRIAGIIDFEDAGSGNRAIDLASLLYQMLLRRADSSIVGRLARRIVELSGEAGLNVYLVAYVLTRMRRPTDPARPTLMDDQIIPAARAAASFLDARIAT